MPSFPCFHFHCAIDSLGALASFTCETVKEAPPVPSTPPTKQSESDYLSPLTLTINGSAAYLLLHCITGPDVMPLGHLHPFTDIQFNPQVVSLSTVTTTCTQSLTPLIRENEFSSRSRSADIKKRGRGERVGREIVAVLVRCPCPPCSRRRRLTNVASASVAVNADLLNLNFERGPRGRGNAVLLCP